MKILIMWIKIQFSNFMRIFRLVHFEKKSVNNNYIFGLFWEFVSPAIQITIYYLIFGIRLNGQLMIGTNIPYIYWMLVGVIPWFYISSSIVVGASSIYQNLNLISKTKFPIEILPTISIVKGLNNFFTMSVLLVVYFFSQEYYPTIEWAQWGYYFLCMVFLLVSISVFTSAVTVMFRDLQILISSCMRLLFFVSGVVVNVTNKPESTITKLMLLNPFVYIIEGFRDSFFSRGWFFYHPWKMVYFFSSMLLVLIIGIYINEKYKNDFVEYI